MIIDLKTCVGKYFQVLDKDNNVIAQGKCIGFKPNFKNQNIEYISFDNKWFFGNQKLSFKEVEPVDTIIPNNIPSFLVWDYWRNNKRGIEVDVYRDFSYDEIDPPIKSYIDELNLISPYFETIESCCGHNKRNWFVGFIFYDMKVLSKFLEVINMFKDDLILISNYTYLQFDNGIQLRLCPNSDIKDFEMKLLDKFVKRLKIKFNCI